MCLAVRSSFPCHFFTHSSLPNLLVSHCDCKVVKGTVVFIGEVVGVVCQWLEQNDDLDLRTLAQIEAKVALRFEAPEFTDLGHNSFLHLVTHNPAILYVIEKSSLQIGRSLDNNDMSRQAQLKQVPKEHVLDFLQQCGLGRIPVNKSAVTKSCHYCTVLSSCRYLCHKLFVTSLVWPESRISYLDPSKGSSNVVILINQPEQQFQTTV